MISVKQRKRRAPTPTAVLDAPVLENGEIEERPAPAPSASKISESAAVTKAPAATAAQETPDPVASERLGAYESYGTAAAPLE
jgi:hypothetical protein